MFISVLISSFLLINASAETEGNVTKTITCLVTRPDEHYKRFIKTVYARNSNKFEHHDYSSYYVLRTDQPLNFEKYTYYWNETHEDLKDIHYICEYRINILDSKELSHTYFPNGKQLKSMFFTCPFPYSCDRLECSIESRFVFSVILVLFLALVIFFARKCIMKEIEQMEKIQAREERRGPQPPPIPIPMSSIFLESDLQEQPPPSYNTVFSGAPPSYESVIRDKVTYTLPSYSAIA